MTIKNQKHTPGAHGILSIRNLSVSIDGTPILKDVSFDVAEGEVVALMGPNGSGKSTLAHVLMGHPRYEVTGGRVAWQPSVVGKQSRPDRFAPYHREAAVRGFAPTRDDLDLLSLKPEERAKLGLFLSFQYPQEIAGVPFGKFLRTAYNETRGTQISVREFLGVLQEACALLGMDASFAQRSLNEGFSGGEKKRAEILQLAVLEPTFAILDETDSGLDVDALRAVASGINALRRRSVIARSEATRLRQGYGGQARLRSPIYGGQAKQSRGSGKEVALPATRPEGPPPMAVLVITHYERFLEFLVPDRVLVMKDGRIVAEGTTDLADRVQREGYGAL